MRNPLSKEQLSNLIFEINQRRFWAKYFLAKGDKGGSKKQEEKAKHLEKALNTLTKGDNRAFVKEKRNKSL